MSDAMTVTNFLLFLILCELSIVIYNQLKE